jgi:peroxiredoxin
MIGKIVPDITFHTRVRDDRLGGDNPYRWQEVSTSDIFDGKKVIVFSLPGAFTPTCSTYQLPDFEMLYPAFATKGIDAIYCMSVNDTFVMNAWAKQNNLRNVQVIPDGSGNFTRAMDMLVTKDNLGFGLRSWRYAMIVNDGIIEKMFVEKGKRNEADDDPYEVTSPQHILENLE